MKLENTNVEFMDLSYEIPAPGVSICVFDEGITKMTNEKSGKTTLRMPLSIQEVVEGPEDNEGKKFSHFCPIQTAYGERQLQSILSMVGLLEGFVAKFQGEIDPLEDVFIAQLQVKLPGKRVKVTHDTRKDKKDKDQVNVVRLEKVGGNSGIGKPAPVKQVHPEPKQPAQVEESENW